MWCKIVLLYDIDFNVWLLEIIIIYEWILFSFNLFWLVCFFNDVNFFVIMVDEKSGLYI